MTGYQSPKLLADLYRDLRDRRLLALAVVLLVAIPVVPIALASSPKSTPPTGPAQGGPVARNSSTPAAKVVAYEPGLRDFRRRLKGDPPKDPFEQQFTVPSGLGAAQLAQAGAPIAGDTGAVSPASSSVTTPLSTSVPSGGNAVSQPITETVTKTKYVAYRIKIRTGQVDDALETRDQVGTFVPLPSESVPALAFIGVTTDSSLDAKTASFLISSGVSSISGEGVCILGSPCQLLSLKPGQYEDLAWTDGLTYRVKVLKFERHTHNQLPSSSGGQGSSSGRRG